jgi:hypothetical protein
MKPFDDEELMVIKEKALAKCEAGFDVELERLILGVIASYERARDEVISLTRVQVWHG